MKCVPGPAFRHWKKITFQEVDMSDLLNRIRLRILRDHFDYLHNTADALQHARLLEGLVVSENKVEPLVEVVVPARKRKPTRKAPLDNMHTSCDCVYVNSMLCLIECLTN